LFGIRYSVPTTINDHNGYGSRQSKEVSKEQYQNALLLLDRNSDFEHELFGKKVKIICWNRRRKISQSFFNFAVLQPFFVGGFSRVLSFLFARLSVDGLYAWINTTKKNRRMQSDTVSDQDCCFGHTGSLLVPR
jgi:hypothetical protein